MADGRAANASLFIPTAHTEAGVEYPSRPEVALRNDAYAGETAARGSPKAATSEVKSKRSPSPKTPSDSRKCACLVSIVYPIV